MRRSVALTLFLVGFVAELAACKKEEPPPPKPPEIRAATVECEDAQGQDFQVVREVGVEIVDSDRDLVTSTLFATINGVPMAEIADGDADDVFTWAPPTSWDPPMVCNGTFRVVAEIADATGLQTKQTFEIEK